jgi:hypothetical protein
MDALKLRMRAKDQLHPIMQELVTGYARFPGSKDWEGRSVMVSWLITLNGMKASEEITEEQSRQVWPVLLCWRSTYVRSYCLMWTKHTASFSRAWRSDDDTEANLIICQFSARVSCIFRKAYMSV